MILKNINPRLRIFLALALAAAICGGLVLYFLMDKEEEVIVLPQEVIEPEPVVVEVPVPDPKIEIIGSSVQGRKIESHTFGSKSDVDGETLLFVGGIHGGYEWNTVLLAYQLIDYFKINKETIPAGIQVIIVPSANPDGLFSVVEKEGRFIAADIPVGKDESIGRFNANSVDLNRNFGCKWQPESSWRGEIVSAGTMAFSEPEAQTIRNIVLTEKPAMVAFLHSQGDAVFASECTEGILPQTLDIMNVYAASSGYTPVESFDAYPITGDAEGWLASIGIPAITVELSTHETIEFEKNLAGIKALFKYYSEQSI